MKNIDQILDIAVTLESCVVSPPCGLPIVDEDLNIPDDVICFYERIGGMIINKDGQGGSWVRILSPNKNIGDSQIMIIFYGQDTPLMIKAKRNPSAF